MLALTTDKQPGIERRIDITAGGDDGQGFAGGLDPTGQNRRKRYCAAGLDYRPEVAEGCAHGVSDLGIRNSEAARQMAAIDVEGEHARGRHEQGIAERRCRGVYNAQLLARREGVHRVIEAHGFDGIDR